MLHTLPPFKTDDLSLMGKLYSPEQCNSLLKQLIATINWNEDYCIVHGRKFEIPRLQAWYADEGILYSYSNNLLKTQNWLKPLLAIKHNIEKQTAQQFNSVLVTYYRDGNDYVGWHADDEEELGIDPFIASLSLGATRTFQYRHKRENLTGDISLTNGDLLLMRPDFQANWEHRAPSEPAVSAPRVNLTFRTVVPLDDCF